MATITPTNLRNDLFNVLKNTIKFNEITNIATKEGNAVLISEEEYNGLMATLEIYSNPKLKKQIVDGLNASESDMIDEEDISWENTE